MANLRSGLFGAYYGSFYNESVTLTESEKTVNAWYIYYYFRNKGWSVEAICGLLGNMEHESALNPGRWQSENVGGGPAYGIVQWDPWTKYVNWCTSNGRNDPSEMDNNLDRIIWELENGEQYYKTSGYPETFKEFSISTKTPYYLACAFAWNYERSYTVLYGTEAEKEALRQRRGNSANKWYTVITGSEPPVIPTPTPTPTNRKKMPLWMYLRYF